MNELRTLYGPDDVRPFYPEIVPVYQRAFAGSPWNEVSKCEADEMAVVRCASGLSALAIGETCVMCGNCPKKEAYEYGELVSRFETVGLTRPSIWYTERNNQGMTLAALAWRATPDLIAAEKYTGMPSMASWLVEKFPGSKGARWYRDGEGEPFTDKIGWIDEVFADREIKPSGNLSNFGAMCMAMAEQLDIELLAFRTKNPRMLSAVRRTFCERAKIFAANKGLPDERDFVIIDTMIEVEAQSSPGIAPEYWETWVGRVRNPDIPGDAIPVSKIDNKIRAIANGTAYDAVRANKPSNPLPPY